MPNKHLALSVLLFSVIALAAPPEPIDAGKTKANVFESSFFHFRYEFPKAWFALDDRTRLAENNKRYRDALSEPARPNDANQGPITEASVPYILLFAARTAVASAEEKPMPRVQIQAIQRGTLVREPGDPAKIYIKMARPKVLRGPEEVVVAGHEFVRTDFQLQPASLLSQFVTASGSYIIEFELRASNEKDLADLVSTMQTLKFSDH
jgi:hypothetical protein